jgi:hypothetical protein
MPGQMKTKNSKKKPLLKSFKKKRHRPILLGKVKNKPAIMDSLQKYNISKTAKKVE